jgi:hypothetical protein
VAASHLFGLHYCFYSLRILLKPILPAYTNLSSSCLVTCRPSNPILGVYSLSNPILSVPWAPCYILIGLLYLSLCLECSHSVSMGSLNVSHPALLCIYYMQYKFLRCCFHCKEDKAVTWER